MFVCLSVCFFVFKGTCVDKINGFTCICPTGFSGVRCDSNIDDCLATPCVNGMQFYIIESSRYYLIT